MFLVLIAMQDEKTNEIRCPWCILVVRRLLAVPDIQVYILQNHNSELGSFLLNSFSTTNHTINLLAKRERYPQHQQALLSWSICITPAEHYFNWLILSFREASEVFSANGSKRTTHPHTFDLVARIVGSGLLITEKPMLLETTTYLH